MAYRAVIFDLFGTLAEFSAHAHDHVLVAMAAALDISEQELVRVWDTIYEAQEQGGFASLEAAIHHLCGAAGGSQVEVDTRVAAACALYRDFQRRTLTPRPEAIPMLAHLRQAGYATGLISNCPTVAAELWPESPLAALIDVALFSCTVGLQKPDPRIYHMVCDRLGVTPEQCLYVGDGGSRELSGAVACGMDALLLQPAHEDPDDARRLGRQQWTGMTIQLLSEIPALLSPAL